MKKFLIILCAFLFLGTDIVWAETQYPVFSSALGGGGGYYTRRGVRRSVYRPDGAQTAVVSARTVNRPRKKIVLQYAPGQIDLTNEQMEKLMPVIRRIQEGKVGTIELIGICRNYATTATRLTNLSRILYSYAPALRIHDRNISGPAVVDSNDNTVEFVEYW